MFIGICDRKIALHVIFPENERQHLNSFSRSSRHFREEEGQPHQPGDMGKISPGELITLKVYKGYLRNDVESSS